MKNRSNGSLTRHDPFAQSIYGSSLDIIAVNQVTNFIRNASSARQDWLTRGGMGSSDIRRNIGDECGYPKVINLEDYHDMYLREPYGARVVEFVPKECWQIQPSIYETEDDTVTQFEEDWDHLGATLNEGLGLYNGELGNPIWEVCQRADVLSGIGEYGVIVIGTDDTNAMEEPFQFREGNKTNVLYIRPFPQVMAQIIAVEQNPKSRRFGRPTMYQITTNDPRASFGVGTGMVNMSFKAHWTRVVHIADNLESNDIYGAPRMRAVYNTLYDIQKVRGGSAEMFWKGGLNGLFFGTNPQLGGDVEIDVDLFRDNVEKFMNGLERYLAAPGMTAQSLAPNVADPSNHLNCHIEAICVKLGAPKRKFMGSERGELASTQDEDDWNGRIRNRNNTYTTPKLILPLVDRLIAMGVLTKPAQYYCDWPDLESQSKGEQATIAVQLVTAMAQYIQSGADALIPPEMFLTRILKFSDDEAAAITKAALKHLEDENSNVVNPEARKEVQANQPEPPPPPQIVAPGAKGMPKPGQPGFKPPTANPVPGDVEPPKAAE